MSKEPIPDRQQAENVKAHADKAYEAGRMSGAKYTQTIARANKVRKRK